LEEVISIETDEFIQYQVKKRRNLSVSQPIYFRRCKTVGLHPLF